MANTLELKITLDVDPPVWRRVLVPADLPLGGLHVVIQLVFGWRDEHLHKFIKGKRQLGPPSDVDWDAEELEDEDAVAVSELLSRRGAKLHYLYDYGDSWMHEIRLEKRPHTSEDDKVPLCVAGEGACPPEDCGGAPGYARLLEIAADPDHPERGELEYWVGEDFDPERFDVDEANARLWSPTELGPLPLETYLDEGATMEHVAAFFAAAARLFRSGFDRCFTGGDFLLVDSAELGISGAVALVTKGSGIDDIGISLFPSVEDSAHMMESIMEEHEPGALPFAARVLHFVPGDEILPELRREISDHAWEIADDQAYPAVVALDPEGGACALGDQDFILMGACVEALAALAVRKADLIRSGLPATETVAMDDATVRIVAAPNMAAFPDEDDTLELYDAEVGPSLDWWMSLDEDSRQLEVEEYHRQARPHPRPQDPTLHAIIHMTVENQLAERSPREAAEAFERLMSSGLSRHEAVHAVGSVAASAFYDAASKRATDHGLAKYRARLRDLTVESWRANPDDAPPKRKRKKKRRQKPKGRRRK